MLKSYCDKMCDVRGSLVEWLPPGDNTVPWKICKNPAKTKNRRNTLSSEDWVMSQIEKLQIVPGEEEVNDSNVAIDEDGFGWGDDLMCDEDDNSVWRRLLSPLPSVSPPHSGSNARDPYLPASVLASGSTPLKQNIGDWCNGGFANETRCTAKP